MGIVMRTRIGLVFKRELATLGIPSDNTQSHSACGDCSRRFDCFIWSIGGFNYSISSSMSQGCCSTMELSAWFSAQCWLCLAEVIKIHLSVVGKLFQVSVKTITFEPQGTKLLIILILPRKTRHNFDRVILLISYLPLAEPIQPEETLKHSCLIEFWHKIMQTPTGLVWIPKIFNSFEGCHKMSKSFYYAWL